MHDHKDAMMALLLWLYNTAPNDTMAVVYGAGRHPSYINEKLERYHKSVTAWVGTLDNKCQARLFDAAWDKYGETEAA